MVYKIKKFLSNKLSILNKDFDILKYRNGFLSKNDRDFESRKTV